MERDKEEKKDWKRGITKLWGWIHKSSILRCEPAEGLEEAVCAKWSVFCLALTVVREAPECTITLAWAPEMEMDRHFTGMDSSDWKEWCFVCLVLTQVLVLRSVCFDSFYILNSVFVPLCLYSHLKDFWIRKRNSSLTASCPETSASTHTPKQET